MLSGIQITVQFCFILHLFKYTLLRRYPGISNVNKARRYRAEVKALDFKAKAWSLKAKAKA